MKSTTPAMVVAVLLLTQCVGRPTCSADWTWNPFATGKKSSADKGTTQSAKAKKSDTGPVRSTASTVHRPSVFQRIGTSTKRFFGSAKDTLTFQKKKPTKKPLSGQTKSKSWSRGKAKEDEGSSWFGSWFRKEELRQPQTVGEWMAQDRIDY